MTANVPFFPKSYPFFQANQILTSDDLNDLRAYLDEQNHSTRIYLIGTGIACGLNIRKESNGVTITEGCGITSEGYLICHEETTYTLRATTDSDYILNGDTTIQARELFASEPADVTTESLGASSLNGKVIVLYLECIDIDRDTCTNTNCDEKGENRTFRLHVLAVDKSRIRTSLGQSESELEASLNGRFNLPLVRMPRIRQSYLIDGPDEITTLDQLRSIFDNAVTSLGPFLDGSTSTTLTDLASLIARSYDIYRPVLSHLYDEVDVSQFEDLIQEALEAAESYYSSNTTLFQYYYDFIRDLILAFREFADEAFDLMAECCPDITAFPKYLMLGVVGAAEDCKPSIYRNHFRQPPIYNGNELRLKRVQRLHLRLVRQCQSFEITPVDNLPIRVTPSVCGKVDLSEKAIPFYYNIAKNGEELLKLWSFDLYRRCRYNRILSYSRLYDATGNLAVSFPCDFDLEEYNFYRIEGILGFPYPGVIDFLQEVREDHALSFEIAAVKLGEVDETEEVELDCYFKDLELLYKTIREEFLCLMEQVITQFGDFDLLDEQDPNAGDEGTYTPSYPDLIMDYELVDQAAYGETFFQYSPQAIEVALQTGFAPRRVKAMAAAEKTKVGQVMYEYYSQTDNSRITANGAINAINQETTPTAPPEKLSAQAQWPIAMMVVGEYARVSMAPPSVQELSFESSQVAIGTLVETAQNYWDLIPDLNLDAGDEANIREILNQILNDCTQNTIATLEEEWNTRKTELLDNKYFHRYIKKHPGLDHKAGVPEGGTFVLVYDENDSVVADFCLPYLCCSDCPPIGFIIQNIEGPSTPDYTIGLDTNEICVSESSDITVTVSPVDEDNPIGSIRFMPENKEVALSGTPDTITINPNALSVGLQTVEYLVDNEVVATTLLVVKPVEQIAFSVEDPVLENDQVLIRIIDITPVDEASSYVYNSTPSPSIIEQESDPFAVRLLYNPDEIPEVESFSISVSVGIANPCLTDGATTDISNPLFDPVVDTYEIQVDDTPCTASDPIKITILKNGVEELPPAGELTGTGILDPAGANDFYRFDPSVAGEGSTDLEYEVGGDVVATGSVTVGPIQDVNFSPSSMEDGGGGTAHITIRNISPAEKASSLNYSANPDPAEIEIVSTSPYLVRLIFNTSDIQEAQNIAVTVGPGEEDPCCEENTQNVPNPFYVEPVEDVFTIDVNSPICENEGPVKITVRKNGQVMEPPPGTITGAQVIDPSQSVPCYQIDPGANGVGGFRIRYQEGATSLATADVDIIEAQDINFEVQGVQTEGNALRILLKNITPKARIPQMVFAAVPSPETIQVDESTQEALFTFNRGKTINFPTIGITVSGKESDCLNPASDQVNNPDNDSGGTGGGYEIQVPDQIWIENPPVTLVGLKEGTPISTGVKFNGPGVRPEGRDFLFFPGEAGLGVHKIEMLFEDSVVATTDVEVTAKEPTPGEVKPGEIKPGDVGEIKPGDVGGIKPGDIGGVVIPGESGKVRPGGLGDVIPVVGDGVTSEVGAGAIGTSVDLEKLQPFEVVNPERGTRDIQDVSDLMKQLKTDKEHLDNTRLLTGVRKNNAAYTAFNN
ncbi:MAG: hypothetical protein AAFP19_16115, partial [Bacteroidota bacterium]